MKNQSSLLWFVLLLTVGVASILDNNLSEGWIAAKLIAVGVLAFALGMSYSSTQPRKKSKK